MRANWKNTKNGKTVVTVLPGTDNEKRFTLPVLAFSGKEIAGFLDETTDMVKVQGKAQHEGANDEGTGGVRHKVKGLDNPADLAAMVREAIGEKGEKRERKPRKPRVKAETSGATVGSNGAAAH